MSELRKLTEVNFDELSLDERFAYLKASLTTQAPTFYKQEPELKKSTLLDWPANKPLRTWGALAAVLALLVWIAMLASALHLWVAIAFWTLLVAGLVAYLVYRKKVDGFFKGWYDKQIAKYTQAHSVKLEKYNADLQQYQEALDAYNSRELTYGQAADTVDRLFQQHGVNFCQHQLGVEEGELIALHYIERPHKDSIRKMYGEHEIHGTYYVQYICMTDNELYEFSGLLNLLSAELTDYTTSRILYSRIHGCDERRSPQFGMNYFGVTSLNQDGSASDVIHIPSIHLMPGKQYYIYSVTWATVSKADPTYSVLRDRRKMAERLMHKPLAYEEFQETIRLMNSCRCIQYQYREEPANTAKDLKNLELARLIIERSVNRKIRECSM